MVIAMIDRMISPSLVPDGNDAAWFDRAFRRDATIRCISRNGKCENRRFAALMVSRGRPATRLLRTCVDSAGPPAVNGAIPFWRDTLFAHFAARSGP
jgi:hypothetical protein